MSAERDAPPAAPYEEVGAIEAARSVFDYVARAAESQPDGVRWQADEAGYASPDFMCGAAGVGHFYLRLAAPHRVPLPIA